MDSTDAIVAISIPLGTLIILCVFLYYLHVSRIKKLDTLVKIVELGGNVDPGMMKMLSAGNTKSYKTDFKYGLIWLAIGIPLTLSIAFESGATQAVMGLIPVLIGIAYMISGKYRWREEDS